MEILYQLSNGEIFNFSVSKYCKYSGKNVYKCTDLCPLSDDFSFRFTETSFEYIYKDSNIKSISAKYGSLCSNVNIMQLDDKVLLLITKGYALFIYKNKPLSYIDYIENNNLVVFDSKLYLFLHLEYGDKLNWILGSLKSANERWSC